MCNVSWEAGRLDTKIVLRAGMLTATFWSAESSKLLCKTVGSSGLHTKMKEVLTFHLYLKMSRAAAAFDIKKHDERERCDLKPGIPVLTLTESLNQQSTISMWFYGSTSHIIKRYNLGIQSATHHLLPVHLVGSSKNMTGGLLTSSRAMARRLHWPPDSELVRVWAQSRSPKAVRISFTWTEKRERHSAGFHWLSKHQ